jgi:hypothetical protein
LKTIWPRTNSYGSDFLVWGAANFNDTVIIDWGVGACGGASVAERANSGSMLRMGIMSIAKIRIEISRAE